MKLFSFFSGRSGMQSDAELIDIFPFPVKEKDFTRADVFATYTKILTDVLERTHGIPQAVVPLLWDNCVQNESQYGLITLLVSTMVDKTDLYLVYAKESGVLRKATAEEAAQIRKDYSEKAESKVGVYISFRNYRRTDMLVIYSALEFCILASLHKTVNISKAVQIKIKELRASVSLADAAIAGAQAKALAEALRSGKDIALDAGDEITTATPNTDPTEKAIAFLDAKRAYYLDLPISYVSGMQTPGIGSTGEADMRAVERGLKQYFFSIIHPVLYALFGADTVFRSHDFRQMSSALEALKTFELTEGTPLLSQEAQRDILGRLFDLDPDVEEKALKAEAAQREKDAKERAKNAPVVPRGTVPPEDGAA